MDKRDMAIDTLEDVLYKLTMAVLCSNASRENENIRTALSEATDLVTKRELIKKAIGITRKSLDT